MKDKTGRQTGRLADWKTGRLEDWKDGRRGFRAVSGLEMLSGAFRKRQSERKLRLPSLPPFHPSTLPSFHSSSLPFFRSSTFRFANLPCVRSRAGFNSRYEAFPRDAVVRLFSSTSTDCFWGRQWPRQRAAGATESSGCRNSVQRRSEPDECQEVCGRSAEI